MANTKNKVKTPKNGSKKSNGKGKVGRPRKSFVNVNTKNNKPVQVMKESRTSRLQTTDNKQNQDSQIVQVVNDDFINERFVKILRIPSNRSILNNGHIKHKNKFDLKLYNNILKSELLIEESNDVSSEKDSGLNNNITSLEDQNKDENAPISIFNIGNLFKKDQKKVSKPKKKRKIKEQKIRKIKEQKIRRIKQQKNRQIREQRKKRTLEEVIIKQQSTGQNLIFECDHCQRKFLSKSSLRRHIYLHLDFTNYPCTKCNKNFRKQLYLSAHIKRQHPNWSEHFMCTICDKPFLLKENLKIHLLSHTRTESMFKCIYCKEQYSDQEELINHEKEHLIDGLYQCIICEMTFDCRNRLTFHYKTHLRVKDYICQHCGKEFLRINSMRRHVQICHGGVRIQCPICKKYLKGHLTEHMRTHEKDRPHVCKDCGKLFTQSTQLNVHRRSHTGARPYPCRICGRAFSHSNALMLHIRRHTGEKPFVCAMCPLSFSQLPHMKAHMKNIHNKLNPYKCKKCKQFFRLKVDVESHMKSCTIGDKQLSFEEQIQASVQIEEIEVESAMSISRMRFLLALLLTMIATKEKLKYLGFNKRPIDDLLVESLEAMGHKPCKDESLTPYKRLKANIDILLIGTVPKEKMENFKKENKSTEELLELLTNEKKN